MEPELLQLGGSIIIALAAFELIKYIIGMFIPSDGKKYQEQMLKQVSNHLHTEVAEIGDGIEALRNDLREYHEAEYTALVEIKTVLRERK
jgi:hypothetical protein